MPQRQLSQTDFSRELWRAIVPPLLLLAAHAVLLSLVLLYWMQANDAARHSEHAVSATNNLERLLYQIDSAVRGFRLADDRSLLNDYGRNVQAIVPALDDLSRLVKDRPQQTERLNALTQLFRQWQALEDACLQRTGPTDPNGILEQAGLMRRIHAQLSEIAAAEAVEQHHNYTDQRQATITAVLGGISFSMVLGVLLALINRRTVINLSAAYQRALQSEVKASQATIEAQRELTSQRERVLADERQAHSDLIRSGRIKDEFLATLSHELRTPMTAILGWAKLLRDPKIRESLLDRAIEAIDSSSRTQARLIDDLLDMSRIMSGKLAIKTEVIDFRPVVDAVIESVMPAASNKKIQITLTTDDTRELIVHGDAARLQQVVWNLLTNAVKFTPSGGKVAVMLRAHEESARVSVTDTGQGIDPAFLEHVFERFRQADGATTRTYGGLGLGLAIVKNLVESHGGTVRAQSDGPGHGATFSFNIPLATASGPQIPAAGADEDYAMLNGRKILIVEDDVDAAFVLQTILEQSGADVVAVQSAADAVQALRQNHFELMFSDIGMPGTDGYGLIRQVRGDADSTSAAIPSVALTAFARPEDRTAAYSAGFNAHLAKPVTPSDLRACAVELLSTHGKGHQKTPESATSFSPVRCSTNDPD